MYLNGEFVVKNEVLTAYDSMCLRFENLINKNYSIGYKKVKLGQKFNVLSFDKKKVIFLIGVYITHKSWLQIRQKWSF